MITFSQTITRTRKHAHDHLILASRPDNANDWNNLGVAYYRAGDWKNAVTALEKTDQMLNGGDRYHELGRFRAEAAELLGVKQK